MSDEIVFCKHKVDRDYILVLFQAANQAPLPAFQVATRRAGLDYLAIAGTLQRLAGKCPDEILQPVLDWLEDQ